MRDTSPMRTLRKLNQCLLDMGIHNLAPVFSALQLGAPATVHASSTPVYPDSVPLASVVHYEFAGAPGQPSLWLHWYDGCMMPPRPEELEPGEELDREDGIILVGTQGKMLVEGWGGHSPRLIPDQRMRDYARPPKTLPRSIGHHQEWLRACKEGTPTDSNFDFAARVTEVALLGSICLLYGKKLEWDAEKMCFPNEPAADKFLCVELRKGWDV